MAFGCLNEKLPSRARCRTCKKPLNGWIILQDFSPIRRGIEHGCNEQIGFTQREWRCTWRCWQIESAAELIMRIYAPACHNINFHQQIMGTQGLALHEINMNIDDRNPSLSWTNRLKYFHPAHRTALPIDPWPGSKDVVKHRRHLLWADSQRIVMTYSHHLGLFYEIVAVRIHSMHKRTDYSRVYVRLGHK
jgi:hypothetical protein